MNIEKSRGNSEEARYNYVKETVTKFIDSHKEYAEKNFTDDEIGEITMNAKTYADNLGDSVLREMIDGAFSQREQNKTLGTVHNIEDIRDGLYKKPKSPESEQEGKRLSQ